MGKPYRVDQHKLKKFSKWRTLGKWVPRRRTKLKSASWQEKLEILILLFVCYTLVVKIFKQLPGVFFPLLKRVISAEGCDHSDQQQSELPQFSRNRDYIGYDFWETREWRKTCSAQNHLYISCMVTWGIQSYVYSPYVSTWFTYSLDKYKESRSICEGRALGETLMNFSLAGAHHPVMSGQR